MYICIYICNHLHIITYIIYIIYHNMLFTYFIAKACEWRDCMFDFSTIGRENSNNFWHFVPTTAVKWRHSLCNANEDTVDITGTIVTVAVLHEVARPLKRWVYFYRYIPEMKHVPKTNEKDWKRTPSADKGLNVSVDFVIIRPFHHRILHHSLLPDRKVVTCVLFGFVGIHPTLIRCSQMSIFKQNIVASQGNKMVQTWATCSLL